jgi:hypothetical protein
MSRKITETTRFAIEFGALFGALAGNRSRIGRENGERPVCPRIVPAGRYDDGIHIENMNGALWVHDDTVSPWTGSFSAGALFTGNFWEHGFVDLIGGTFFVGAFAH